MRSPSIVMEVLNEGRLRGYIEALGLYACWEDGMLRFFDPVTRNYLRTYDEAEARVGEDSAARVAAENRAGAAEARMAELEAELRRLRGE